MKITVEQAQRVLEIVDHGLVCGVGAPEPGKMCVEAAVCFALGLPHGDDPECVSNPDRWFKITLNDSQWSSPAARAAGLRRVAVLQLGTRGADRGPWVEQLVELTIRRVVPAGLEAMAAIDEDHAAALRAAARRCETEGSEAALGAAAYEVDHASGNWADFEPVDFYRGLADVCRTISAVEAQRVKAVTLGFDVAGTVEQTHIDLCVDLASLPALVGALSRGSERDGILRLAARCAEEAYERTGSPGLDLLHQIEGAA